MKKRSGLLIFGPPGCGKTLLAKAIATECSVNFISIKGPELLNQYVGETEKNIRDIFSKAKLHSPCVLFFDEIDAVTPIRSKHSENSSVMDRIVSQLISEIDDIDNKDNIIIVASTNRPDLIDEGLLRPGRFDKMIYVGFPINNEEKLKILESLTLNYSINKEDLISFSSKIPNNYSGADISSIINIAISSKLKKLINCSNLENNEFGDRSIENNVNKLKLELSDLEEAIKKTKSSIKDEDLLKYKLIREKYSC